MCVVFIEIELLLLLLQKQEQQQEFDSDFSDYFKQCYFQFEMLVIIKSMT